MMIILIIKIITIIIIIMRVVTIAMMCFTLLHFENFNIFGGLYLTQSNYYDGVFTAKIVSR